MEHLEHVASMEALINYLAHAPETQTLTADQKQHLINDAHRGDPVNIEAFLLARLHDANAGTDPKNVTRLRQLLRASNGKALPLDPHSLQLYADKIIQEIRQEVEEKQPRFDGRYMDAEKDTHADHWEEKQQTRIRQIKQGIIPGADIAATESAAVALEELLEDLHVQRRTERHFVRTHKETFIAMTKKSQERLQNIERRMDRIRRVRDAVYFRLLYPVRASRT